MENIVSLQKQTLCNWFNCFFFEQKWKSNPIEKLLSLLKKKLTKGVQKGENAVFWNGIRLDYKGFMDSYWRKKNKIFRPPGWQIFPSSARAETGVLLSLVLCTFKTLKLHYSPKNNTSKLQNMYKYFCVPGS